jgi:hypothetical protein
MNYNICTLTHHDLSQPQHSHTPHAFNIKAGHRRPDLLLPANFANSAPLSSSPKRMGGIALLTAACTGKGHLDETLRYE